MPTEVTTWFWEEAFDKFGFDDGDGLVMTHVVERVLHDAGYTVTTESWGCHNFIIVSIADAAGTELIPSDAEVGYDDARDYLPEAIVALLDEDPRTGN